MMKEKSTSRLAMGLAFGMLLCSTVSTGCIYLGSVMSPITVEAEKNVESLTPEDTHIEARSSESSHISGRNNMTLQAAITESGPQRVQIEGLMVSTEIFNTDPNNFYIYLTAGEHSTPVSLVGVGEATNTPYSYNYTYTVEVEAGRVEFSDGSSATIYEDQQRTGTAEEPYYSRPVTLVFEGDEVIPSDADDIELEIRDLGISMQLKWNLQ